MVHHLSTAAWPTKGRQYLLICDRCLCAVLYLNEQAGVFSPQFPCFLLQLAVADLQ